MLVHRCTGVIRPIAAQCKSSGCPSSQLFRRIVGTLGRLPKATKALRREGDYLAANTRSTVASVSMGDVFFLDEFAIRQWDDPEFSGARIQGNKQDFVTEIHKQHSQVCLFSSHFMSKAHALHAD